MICKHHLLCQVRGAAACDFFLPIGGAGADGNTLVAVGTTRWREKAPLAHEASSTWTVTCPWAQYSPCLCPERVLVVDTEPGGLH
jgi:hypothetical protein